MYAGLGTSTEIVAVRGPSWKTSETAPCFFMRRDGPVRFCPLRPAAMRTLRLCWPGLLHGRTVSCARLSAVHDSMYDCQLCTTVSYVRFGSAIRECVFIRIIKPTILPADFPDLQLKDCIAFDTADSDTQLTVVGPRGARVRHRWPAGRSAGGWKSRGAPAGGRCRRATERRSGERRRAEAGATGRGDGGRPGEVRADDGAGFGRMTRGVMWVVQGDARAERPSALNLSRRG